MPKENMITFYAKNQETKLVADFKARLKTEDKKVSIVLMDYIRQYMSEGQ